MLLADILDNGSPPSVDADDREDEASDTEDESFNRFRREVWSCHPVCCGLLKVLGVLRRWRQC